jgi:hypothetical protein
MRPRLVWRVLTPLLVAGCSTGAIASGEWEFWLCAAVWLFVSATSYREFVRVEDGVIYRREMFGWSEPFSVAAVSTVELRRVWGGREPFKHVELCLVAGDARRMTFSLRWWNGVGQLLRMVAEVASEPVGDQLGRRQWRLDLDEETRRRLAPYA